MEPTFDLDRIVEPYPTPEIFTTRVGYAEMIPGPCVRLWLCVEHPPGADGMPGPLELKAKIIKPFECLLSSRDDVGAWMRQRGLIVPKEMPASLYRPPGTTLM